MSDVVDLNYDALPDLTPSYIRAVTSVWNKSTGAGSIPSMRTRVNAVAVRPQHLARYREVCAFERNAQLPVTYPHVLAFPMHMALMTHKRFPLKLLGLVHVRNEITQHRPIDNDETLDLTVRIGEQREVGRGLEFDLVTSFGDRGGRIVWEETGTMLSRRAGGGARSGAGKTPRVPSFEDGFQAHWDVAADIGRRYAMAAGDCNPIHLSRYSARLFGFSRAIATGMWLKARVAAELTPRLPTSAYTLKVAFKKPVFLPAPVSFGYRLGKQGAQFALTDGDDEVLHLQGEVSYS